MRRFDENSRWFSDQNNISIPLMSLHAEIIVDVDGYKKIQLEVIDNKMERIKYPFPTIEEAIAFITDVIWDMREVSEVREAYKDMYGLNKTLPDLKFDLQDETLLYVSEADILELITTYFGQHRKDKIDAEKELYIVDGGPDIRFYIIEHLNIDGISKDIRTLLTEGDIKRVLKFYVEANGLELVDYKYMGGVHRVGYYFDQDTPHFDGIEVHINERKKGVEYQKNNRE